MSPTVTDGLPDGWTFHTIEHGDTVTYEVRTEHRFLVMSTTYHASHLPGPTYRWDEHGRLREGMTP
jgi:hypothetical protein